MVVVRRWQFVLGSVLLGACNRTPTDSAGQGSVDSARDDAKQATPQSSSLAPGPEPTPAPGKIPEPSDLEGPRQAAMALGKQLKAALAEAMAKAGPVEAIAVCNSKAPEIANGLSVDGRTVGRTALKVRNPANRPDPWEQRILEQFAREVEQGKAPGSLEHAEVITTDAGPTLRYMKGIGTEGLCLICHGRDLAPPVAHRIHELYPQDEATGFVPGDLRGAFTVTQALPLP